MCCLCLKIDLSLVQMDAVNDCEGGGGGRCLLFFLWEAVILLIHVSTSSSVWSTFVWWTVCIYSGKKVCWKVCWVENIDELVACTNFSSTSLITLLSMICSSLVWDPMVAASTVYNWVFEVSLVDYTMPNCTCTDQGRHGNSNVGLVFLFWNPKRKEKSWGLFGKLWAYMLYVQSHS